MKRYVALAVFACVIALLVWWAWSRDAAEPNEETEEGGVRSPDPPMRALGASAATPPALASARADGGATVPEVDPKKREEMRRAIMRAWGLGDSPSPAAGAAAASPWTAVDLDGASLAPSYIRSRIREDYLPLAKDCYEKALKRNPRLSGRLETSFTIVGNKNTGGIIDDVKIDHGLGDAETDECLKQSLYGVVFEAPPNDGVVTVKYPLVFSPEDDDAGD